MGILGFPAENLAQECDLRAPANRFARANGNRRDPSTSSRHRDAPPWLRPTDLCCVSAQSLARADKRPRQGKTLGGERVRSVGGTNQLHRHRIKHANVEAAL